MSPPKTNKRFHNKKSHFQNILIVFVLISHRSEICERVPHCPVKIEITLSEFNKKDFSIIFVFKYWNRVFFWDFHFRISEPWRFVDHCLRKQGDEAMHICILFWRFLVVRSYYLQEHYYLKPVSLIPHAAHISVHNFSVCQNSVRCTALNYLPRG